MKLITTLLLVTVLAGCTTYSHHNPYLQNADSKQAFFAACQTKMKTKLPTASGIKFGKGYLLKSHVPVTAVYRTAVHYTLNGTGKNTHMTCFGYHDGTPNTDDIYVRYTRDDEKHQ